MSTPRPRSPMDRALVERRWNWTDDGLLAYALAGLRTIWVFLLLHIWSLWVQPERGEVLALPAVFLLLAGGTLCAQLAQYRARREWQGLLLMVGGGLLALALVLYLGPGGGPALAPWDARWPARLAEVPLAVVFTLIIAAWLWWWGLLAGRDRLYYDTFANNFALGVGALAVSAVLVYGGSLVPVGQALAALLLFFALGLATLAIAGVQSTRRSERRRSEQSFRLSRYWLSMVALVIVALLGAGLLLAQLFTPGFVQRIMDILNFVLDLVAAVLIFVIFLITYPLFWLYEWARRLLPAAREQEPPPPPQLPDFSQQLREAQGGTSTVSPELLLALRVVGGVILGAVIVLAFVLAYRRLRSLIEDDEEVEETRELIFSTDLLKEQLSELFGRRRRQEAAPPPYVMVAGEEPRARVRRVYQSLLRWGAEQGLARGPGLTPGEYALAVGELVPAQRAPIALITEAYLAARYGAGSLSAEAADAVERAWAQVIS